MAFYNLLPVYGTLLGVVFLGETPNWTQFAGGSLVLLEALAALKP
jgi:drug/metabolite transporter (DMT)-like permease